MLMANTAGDMSAYALLVRAYMLFPNEPEQREKYGAYSVATFAAHAADGGCLEIESSTLLRALDAGRDGTLAAADRAVMGGLASGRVLLDVLEHQEAGETEFGLEKAFHTTSQFFISVRSLEGKDYRAGTDAVLKHWRAFRPVAHLWAAHLVLMADWEHAGEGENPQTWIADRQPLMLQLAQALHLKARAAELPRKGGYLQTCADSWELDGVEPIPLAVPALTQSARAWVNAYQPRFR